MRGTLWGGVAAVAMLGASLAATPATSAVLTGTDEQACAPGAASSARVAKGGRLNAEPTEKTAAQREALERRTAQRLQQRYGTQRPGVRRAKIDVHVHMLLKRNGDKNTSNRTVERQMSVLNRAFAGRTSKPAAQTPFRFRVRSIDRTRNTDFYNWKFQDDDKAAKKQLHRGGFDDLNIYIADLSGGLLGYAYYPGLARKKLFRDGLVVHKESLPGGSFDLYDRGDTATHEIGHWMGLYHTFEGSCGPNGDFVTDTPRQLADSNVYKCDEELNTCGENPGDNPLTDPVHNFMNYTSDRCMDRFTRGQRDRMELSWVAYRADG